MADEKKPAGQDDKMAQKLMEELKAQGVDVDQLTQGGDGQPKSEESATQPTDTEKQDVKANQNEDNASKEADKKEVPKKEPENKDNESTSTESPPGEESKAEESNESKAENVASKPEIATQEPPKADASISELAKQIDQQFIQEENALFSITINKYLGMFIVFLLIILIILTASLLIH